MIKTKQKEFFEIYIVIAKKTKDTQTMWSSFHVNEVINQSINQNTNIFSTIIWNYVYIS